uniref:Cytochrome P450 n=1 Tax=Coccolithus braarudii TaxID=221442 RepID=A0A7S0LNJ1_9EUKA
MWRASAHRVSVSSCRVPRADAESMFGIWLIFQVLVLLIALLAALVIFNLHSVRIPGPRHSLVSVLFGSFFDGTIPDISLRHRAVAQLQGQRKAFRLLKFFARPVVYLGGEIPAWFSDRKSDSDREALRLTIPKSILSLRMGPQWSEQRRLMAPIFSVSSLSGYLPLIHQSSEQLAASLLVQCEKVGSDRTLDVHPPLMSWSLDVIGKLAFGHDFGAVSSTAAGEKNAYHTAAEAILNGVVNRAVLRWLSRFNIRTMRACESGLAKYRAAAAKMIDDAARSPATNASQGNSFTARLAKAEGGKLSREHVLQEAIGVLLAGHETSSNTATWALYLLASNPDAQAACRAQAEGAIAARSLEELLSHELLLGCMYEALRLYPVVPVTLKMAPAGAHVAGVPLPKGTLVTPNKVLLGEDPSIFPEPSLFEPRRYARGEFGKHGERIAVFGAGPRACIGLRLAEAEVVSVLAHVLHAFVLEYDGDGKPAENLNITLSPANGMKIKLTPR